MTSAEDTEETPLKTRYSGCDALLPCRLVAPIGLGAMQRHRHTILWTCMVLTCVGIGLAFCGFWGAYSRWDSGLRTLPWVTVVSQSKGKTAYAGVKYVCFEDSNAHGGTLLARHRGEEARCIDWASVDCSSKFDPTVCQACHVQSMAVAVPIVISLLTYLTYAKKTHDRLVGRDRPCVKFMSCFSGLFGGTNFLLTVLAYKNACVPMIANDNISISEGLGLQCILAATVLKFLLGLVHLGIPVEAPGKDHA